MENALVCALGGSALVGSATVGSALLEDIMAEASLMGGAMGGSALVEGLIGEPASAIGGLCTGGMLSGPGPALIGMNVVDAVQKYIKMVHSDSENDTEANLFDVLPVISQAKSCFQLMFGDVQGAVNTQKKFFSKCPVAAQIKSFMQLVDGDIGKAWRTQREFFLFWFDTAVGLAEGTPVIGHFIGALAYITGNKEYVNQCMKSASRTAGVILGAAVGTFFGGPVGAAAGAVGGGLLMDILITGIESAVTDEFTPYGYVAALDKVLKREATAGEIFDILCGVGVEAGMAYLYAKQSARVRSAVFSEQELNPEDIRFSQTSVKGEHVDNMTKTILKNQEKGKMDFTMPSIDAVKMPDGELTSLDNRRLLAAREAKAPIFARVIEGDTPVPSDQSARFSTNGRNPEVMSEAVQNRIAQQRGVPKNPNIPQGLTENPRKTYTGSQAPGGGYRPDLLRYYAGPISEVMTAIANILTPRNRPRD